MYGEDKKNVYMNCYSGNLTMEKDQEAALKHPFLNKSAKTRTGHKKKVHEVCRTVLSGEELSKDSEFARPADGNDDHVISLALSPKMHWLYGICYDIRRKSR